MLLVKWHPEERTGIEWKQNMSKERFGRVHFPILINGCTYLIIQPFDSTKLEEIKLTHVEVISDPHKYEKKIRHAMKALGKTDKEADSPLTDTD